MIEVLFAILAGILTVGAPCILPVLPILLAGTVGETNKSRPAFIVLGFVITFSLTALLLSALTLSFGFDPTTLRYIAIGFLMLFALFLLWSKPFDYVVGYFSRYLLSAQRVGQAAGGGSWGGFVLGVMLGLVWTPCAGPVLGSILTLIATAGSSLKAGILLTAYATGAGIPMLVIGYGGQYITTRVRVVAQYARVIQQLFGLLLLALAVLMYFEYDLVIQARLLEYYPGGFLRY